MSGYVMHKNAFVLCKHPPGNATPTQADTRVSVSEQPVITVFTQYTVSGCNLSTSSGPFCASGMWTKGAERVFASGLPVAIDSGDSKCLTTGTPLDPKVFQKRVTAS